MRLDALNRIGNQVFAISFDPGNYVPINAPVNFPHIWSTSWFDWVQYDSSIKQPMMRNAGEALGVSAKINLKGTEEMLFESTIKIKNLYDMERQLTVSYHLLMKKNFTDFSLPNGRKIFLVLLISHW